MESVRKLLFSRFVLSVGFRSGLRLGRSNTWICFDLNHPIIVLTGCFGSLPFWKVNLHVSLKSFTASDRSCSRTVLYLAPSLFPSTLTSFPVPAEEKLPHRMMLPPSCPSGDDAFRVMFRVSFPPHSVLHWDGKTSCSEQSSFFHVCCFSYMNCSKLDFLWLSFNVDFLLITLT